MKKLQTFGIISLAILTMSMAVPGLANTSMKIEIDVKPLSCPQSINPDSRGKIPVAIITTSSFDAGTVDPPTVLFAGALPLRWAWEDYDGDGDVDLVLKFKTQECNLPGPGFWQVYLEGYTQGGTHFYDWDTVHIVPK